MRHDDGAGIFMTVGELAYSMKISLETVKHAAGIKSATGVLSGSDLDLTLARLGEIMNFHRKGWDLDELNDSAGAWAASLRKLYSNTVAFPASLPPSQGKQIRELVLREAPERVLEIGCFIGISSHWIASALEEQGVGQLDSVDTFLPKYPNHFHFSYLADPYHCATSAAQESGLGHRIQFHRNDSVAHARSLASQEQFDFIFIDGDHTFAGVTRDFLAYFPYLKKGGVILLHDTNPEECGWEGPRRLINTIASPTSIMAVEEIDTEPNFGMAVIRKLSDKAISIPPVHRMAIKAQLVKSALKNQFLQSAPAKKLLRSFIKPTIARFKYS